MTIINTIYIIIYYLSIALLFYTLGYNYNKYKQRPRVSRPKEVTKVKRVTKVKEVSKEKLSNILHNNTNIISPSKINDRRNFEKNLTQ